MWKCSMGLLFALAVNAHGQSVGTFVAAKSAAECADALGAEGALVQSVRPGFVSPSTRHHFFQAFEFSADGDFAITRHQEYPGREVLTVRSTATGEALGSLLWQGKDKGLAELRSVAVDSKSRRVVASAINAFADRSDTVVVWSLDGEQADNPKVIEFPAPDAYFVVPIEGSIGTYRSSISAEHPFFVRAELSQSPSFRTRTRMSENRIIAIQILDWSTGGILNLPQASQGYLRVISQPFSSAYQYALVLQDGETNLQVMSFDELKRNMRQPRSGLAGKLDAFINYATRKREFRSTLVHQERIEQAELLGFAPLVVSRTKSGIFIWNAKTGKLEDQIPAKNTREFRVLGNLGLLAFTDDHERLSIYSICNQRMIAEFPGFKHFNLEYRVKVDEVTGSAIVNMDNGEILIVSQDGAERTNLKIDSVNMAQTSLVTRPNGRYFVRLVQTGSNNLRVSIYSLDHSSPVAGTTISLGGEFRRYGIAPFGQSIFYTEDNNRTGILSLEQLFATAGL